jgi:hypothetical protein
VLQALRLYHYQRSVAIRLCYCPCFLLCSRYHKCVTILFLKLECHPSDILVRLMRYEFTDIHQQGRPSPCLCLLLHMRRTEPHSTSSATASSCRSWNFFFASFLHVFPSAPSFFVSFLTSLCISQMSLQNGCLSSVCRSPLHVVVSGHTRFIHRYHAYNSRNVMTAVLTECH